MRGYAQLTLDQRYQIQECKRWKRKLKLSTIAARVGVSVSTISRELKRNCTAGRGYRAKHAHNLALQRREDKPTTRIDVERWRQVEYLLRQDWSPEQITLWQKKHKLPSVSHESIYQYIYADKREGGDLHKHLRCKKKSRKRYGSYKKRGHIVDRVFIDERAASVEKRLQIGHWELDTIMGLQQRCPIVTLVERKSRYTLIGQVSSNKADNVAKTIIRLLEPHIRKVKTLTSDNGKEFAYHKIIAEKLGAKFYFAHPYASWERALNENTNGLLRQYFPKKSDVSTPEGGSVKGTETNSSEERNPSGGSEGKDKASDAMAAGARTMLETEQATEQWLNQIQHDPLKYLQKRIELETERRRAAGASTPEGGSQW